MNYTWLLLQFDGRINRAKYWLATFGMLAVMIAAVIALASVGTTYGIGSGRYVINVIGISASITMKMSGDTTAAMTSWFPQIVTIPLSLAFAFVYAAVSVKRLHDRNKSGWWILPFIGATGLYTHFGDTLDVAEPFAGLAVAALYAWGFFEMGFLKGTSGTNHFGADPLVLPSRGTPATPVRFATEGGPNELDVAYAIKAIP